MGFWIFMLIMDLLLPFTMIGFGRYFMVCLWNGYVADNSNIHAFSNWGK